MEEELDPEDQRMEKLLKAVKSDKPKVKLDVSKYGSSLNDEELLDWISTLDNHFECEEFPEEQRVRIAKTKLQGHALVWWDYFQSERRKQGKSKITSWDKMISKLKCKFLPKDHQVQMFKRLQNLRQREIDIKSYTEEFYKLSLRSSHHENEDEEIARYVGGLRLNVQDELVLANPRSVEDCYQMAIMVEEKLKRRKDKAVRGRGGASRGRGFMSSSNPTNDNQEDAMKGQEQSDSRGGWRGSRGRSSGGRSS